METVVGYIVLAVVVVFVAVVPPIRELVARHQRKRRQAFFARELEAARLDAAVQEARMVADVRRWAHVPRVSEVSRHQRGMADHGPDAA
jgi:hypothetical protein